MSVDRSRCRESLTTRQNDGGLLKVEGVVGDWGFQQGYGLLNLAAAATSRVSGVSRRQQGSGRLSCRCSRVTAQPDIKVHKIKLLVEDTGLLKTPM